MTLDNLKYILTLNNEEIKKYITEHSGDAATVRYNEDEQHLEVFIDELGEWQKFAVSNDGITVRYNEEAGYLEVYSEELGEWSKFAGGGSGGGGSTAVIEVINLLDSLDFIVPYVQDKGCKSELKYSFSSTYNGRGTATYKVGNNIVYTQSIPQGNITFDVGKYLQVGKINTVTVSVKDSQGNTNTLIYTIEVTQNYITSTFQKISQQTGEFTIPYIPIGSGNKTIHFLVDGVELNTTMVTSSNRIQYQNFKALPHGAHEVSIYMTTELPGYSEIIESNTLKFGIIAIDEGNQTPILFAGEMKNKYLQYDSLSLEYVAFDPNNTYSEVKFLIDGEIVTSVNVDNTVHTWNYAIQTSGSHTITVKMGDLEESYEIEVEAVNVAEATTQGLDFHFTALNRSNDEENPAHYENNGYNVTFNNVNWSSNGWTGKSLDLGVGASIDIDIMPFKDDVTTTRGKTIEVDFKTKNVYDYDSNLIVCKADSKGISITPKEGQININSEDYLEVQFKDEEEIRLSFVISERNVNDPKYQLIYVYANGVISGVIKYSSMDTFNQNNPQGLHIGSDSAGIEIYNIRVYNVALNSYNILDNFIADTIDTATKIERNNVNDIFDQDNMVDYDKLPDNCPYMVIECPELPQYKGDKKKGITGRFVDKANPNKSFTFKGAEIDVQGTSSAGYYIKNFKISLKGGIIDNDGESQSSYVINDGEHPTTVFCLKADVASSEGANNVMLMDLWEETTPYKDEPQKNDPSVRQTIAARPIVVYWYNTETGEYSFRSKYNLNWDKSNYAGFGQTSDYPNAECWEFLDNGLKLTEFRGDDFDTIVTTYEEDGVTVKETHPVWQEAFESRYPKGYEDTINLRRVVSWIVSTDTSQATNEIFEEAKTIDGIEYTNDTPEYRLAKFKSEFEDYFHKKNALYYYIFTDIFLMVDSRAKNQFLSTFDGQKWFFMPYDGDTALGIDNVGALKFGYWLEDTDQVNGNDVYNGQKSVLWINVRKCFAKEIADLAQQIISTGKLNYEYVRDKFNNHQSAWSEAIECANTEVKYIQPYFETGNEAYLDMAQGNKRAQRDYWLYHRLNYWCSKYNIGTSKANYITLRMSEPSGNTVNVVPLDMTLHVTPYSNAYINVNFGQTSKSVRGYLNETTDIVSGLDRPSDSPVYLYNATELKSMGDLSPAYVRYCDISAATNLEELIIGNHSEGYANESLTSLGLGNNKKLKKIDVTNCTALTGSLALGKCDNLTEVYAENTKITSLALATGSPLRKVYLPSTITALSLDKLNSLDELTLQGYDNLGSLYINGGSVDGLELASKCPNLTNVYISGIDTTVYDTALLNRLLTLGGKTPDGVSNTNQSVLIGKITIATPILQSDYDKWTSVWSDLEIVADNIIPTWKVTYKDWNGTVLHTQYVANGSYAHDPISAGEVNTPTKPMSIDTIYTYYGWDRDFNKAIIKDIEYTAIYSESVRQYTVKWFIKGQLVETDVVDVYSDVEFGGELPTSTLNDFFVGWDKEVKNITSNMIVTALFEVATVPSEKPVSKDFIYSEYNKVETSTFSLLELFAICKSDSYEDYLSIEDKIIVKPSSATTNYFVLSVKEFDSEADFHVKWKFDGIINEDGLYIPIKDLNASSINIPNMTGFSCENYTTSNHLATDGSYYYWSGHYPYHAFDNNIETYCEINNREDTWDVDISYDSGDMCPQQLSVYFKKTDDWKSYAPPVTCYFEGLNDDTQEWELINSFIVTGNTYNKIECDNTNYYKTLRIRGEKHTCGWYTQIADVKIEGLIFNRLDTSKAIVDIINAGKLSPTFELLGVNIDTLIRDNGIKYSVIEVTTPEDDWVGKETKLELNNKDILVLKFNSNGIATFRISDTGNYKVSCYDANDPYKLYDYSRPIKIDELGTDYQVSLSRINIVTWADGSWDEILTMLNGHYVSDFNVADYWSVGDTREITINEINSYGGAAKQPAQTLQLTIVSISGEDVMENGTKTAITVRCSLLVNESKMHNTDGQSISSIYEGWKNLDMYMWLNNNFLNALDTKLQSLIKPVKVISHWYISPSYYNTPVVTTYDKVFLPSISEMYGNETKPTSDCNLDEGKQYEYFKSKSNIPLEQNKYQMTRTVMCMSASGKTLGYCYTYNYNASYSGLCNLTYVAPMFCL